VIGFLIAVAGAVVSIVGVVNATSLLAPIMESVVAAVTALTIGNPLIVCVYVICARRVYLKTQYTPATLENGMPAGGAESSRWRSSVHLLFS
jgi:hypothetical protein